MQDLFKPVDFLYLLLLSEGLQIIRRLVCTLSQHCWVRKALTQPTGGGTCSSRGILQPPEHESAPIHSCCKPPLLCLGNVELLLWNKWTLPDVWKTMSVSGVLCLLLACLIQAVDLTLSPGPNQLVDFTFLLPAGRKECFFQPTSKNERIEIEYQVNKKKKIKCFDLVQCLS